MKDKQEYSNYAEEYWIRAINFLKYWYGLNKGESNHAEVSKCG